jgi:PhzF family phenazine biosynthesis protein
MKCYHVDAFSDKLFEGNPAAVCIMESWPSDELMQQIAGENNLSETAFAVKEHDAYSLRWFTPGGEIDLCGHATLATAFVLANFVEPDKTKFVFNTLSGRLDVVRKGDLFEMDFPGYTLKSVPVTDKMEQAIGYRPVEAWMGRDLVCVLDREEKVMNAKPNQTKLLELDGLLLQLTAKGSNFDCVTRTFAPKLNVEEDPVCGSGHCHIVPLWANKLGRDTLVARQVSQRGGTLFCSMHGSRVLLAGHACLYSVAELCI